MRTIIKIALLVYVLAWCMAAEPMLDAHGAIIARIGWLDTGVVVAALLVALWAASMVGAYRRGKS